MLGAIAAVLMVAVAAMTEAGFAGNLRYVALPAALVCVLAGAGWADLVVALARRVGPLGAAAGRRGAHRRGALPYLRADRDALQGDLRVVRLESELYDDLPRLVAAAGGRDAVLRCRPIYARRSRRRRSPGRSTSTPRTCGSCPRRPAPPSPGTAPRWPATRASTAGESPRWSSPQLPGAGRLSGRPGGARRRAGVSGRP